MELLTLARWQGEPVACAYGVTREGEGLSAGLLFVRAGRTRRLLLWIDPQTKKTARLYLPQISLGLARDGYLINAPLEFA